MDKAFEGETVGNILSVADICLWMASSVKVDPKALKDEPILSIRMMFSGVATGASDASGTTVDLTYIWH